MPVTFVSFDTPGWVPDSGDQGGALAVADNVLPVHQSFRAVQQALTQASVTDGPVTGALVHIFQQARVTQYARPNADTTPGIWQPSMGTTLFSQIDAVTPNDASFIYAPNAPSSQLATLALSSISSPGTTSGHVYQVRYAIPATTGAWSLVVKLLQNPGATVIASNTVSGSGAQPGFLQQAWNLTTLQAGAITDYTKLALQFIASAAGTGQLGYAIADIAAGTWLTDTGSGANLYVPISTAPAQSTHYVESAILPVGATPAYTWNLTSLLDPLTRLYHTLKARLWATNSGVTVTVNILQGSTVVGQVNITNAPTTPTDYSVSIPVLTAQGITDYTSLTGQIEAAYPTDVTPTVTQTVLPASHITTPAPWSVFGAATDWQALSDNSDTTGIQAIGGNNTLVGLSTSVVNPQTSGFHVLKIRAAGNPGDSFWATLQQPGANPIITLFIVSGLAGSPTTYSYTLTAAEVAKITAGGGYDTLQINFTNPSSTAVQVFRAEFDVPTPRQGFVSFVELDVPSTAQVQISWADLEAPDPGTSYKGDVPTIYAGTPTKIYTVSSSGWTSVGSGFGAGSARASGWRFLQAGPDIYATNYVDPIQARLGGSGSFSGLISDPSPAPQARFMALVRSQFLMLADINLTNYGPDWIWWSGAGQPTSFTPSATTLSANGFVRARPGQIMGLLGGDFGTLFKRNSIHAITWTGDANVFRIDEVSASVGTPFPNSIVRADGVIYWWGGSSFWKTDGYAAPVRVGDEVLSSYLSDALSTTNPYIQAYDPPDMAHEDQAIVGWYDRSTGLIFWSYMGPFDPPWQRSQCVVYSPTEDRWTHININGYPQYHAMFCDNLNSISTDTHLLKGTTGFTWDGSAASTWFKFSAATTYQATLKTQRRAIGMEKYDSPIGPRLRGFSYVSDPKQDYPIRVRMREVVPVFSDTGNIFGNSTQVTLTIEVSEDPFDRANQGAYRQIVYPPQLLSERMAFPCNDIEGYWWTFQLQFASLTVQRQLYAIKGIYASWEARSRD
jgi:hypothetical protein